MKSLSYWMMLIVASCFMGTVYAEDMQRMYLEGVSILGKQKNAYVSLNGEQVVLQEGDEIAHWQVDNIQPRSISLVSKTGETRELSIHTQVAIPAQAPILPDSDESQMPQEAQLPTETQTYQRPMIPDEDVPPGHRKIRTPFGDFLVKESELTDEENVPVDNPAPLTGPAAMTTQEKNPTDRPKKTIDETGEKTLPTISEEDVPAGHRVVHTPFGDFLVKDGQ